MRHTLLAFLLGLLSLGTVAQQPVKNAIRIVDTLTIQERAERDPVLLRTEVDSLLKTFGPSPMINSKQEPIKNENIPGGYLLTGLSLVLMVLVVLGWLSYKKIRRISEQLEMKNKPISFPNAKEVSLNGRSAKKKSSDTLEERIENLSTELLRLSKENEGLNRVVNEYNGIQHEYDTLKHGLGKTYKVRNYPGFDKAKKETQTLQGVLDTEASVAKYAYEKFLKPILTIADAQKNSPARISAEDNQRLMDLLISLSLLYIEYLYLRVRDLSIGGKMVERIQGFSQGNGIDASLLKKLDMEFGSRALVIRMALNKAGLEHISYPVFDETNLNY